MNTRIKIVKRATLEPPQCSELKHDSVSSDREMVIVIKQWIADHDQRRRRKETQQLDMLFNLGR